MLAFALLRPRTSPPAQGTRRSVALRDGETTGRYRRATREVSSGYPDAGRTPDVFRPRNTPAHLKRARPPDCKSARAVRLNFPLASESSNTTSDTERTAPADSVASPAREAKRPKDIFVDGGQLVFAELGRKLDRDTGLTRARKMLEIARAERETRMTFGGRVAQSGIDPLASLSNYYPSLRLAKLLAAEGSSYLVAVQRYVDQLSIPSDLQLIARRAIGLGPTLKAEPAGELGVGKVANSQELVTAVNQHQHAKLAISDLTLRTVIPGGWYQSLQHSFAYAHTPEMKLAQMRIFARSAELRLRGPNGLEVGDWNAVAAQLPNTEAAAKVLLRLAAANSYDPEKISFHGVPLASATGSAPELARGWRRKSAAEPPEPLAPPYSPQLSAQQIVDLARQNRHTELAIPDECFSASVRQVWQTLDAFLAEGRSPETNLAMLRYYARAAELGYQNLQVIDWGRVSAALPKTKEASSVVARAQRHYAINIGSRFHTKPLGAAVMDVRVFTQHLARGDLAAFTLDDSSLRAMAPSYPSPYHWHEQLRGSVEYHRAALACFERAVDLGIYNTEYLSSYVHSRIPTHVLSDPAILLSVARLALRGNHLPVAFGWGVRAGVSLGALPAFAHAVECARRSVQDATSPLPQRSSPGHRIEQGPLGAIEGDFGALYAARSPQLFELSDHSIAQLQGGGLYVGDWAAHLDNDPRVLRLSARVVELYPAHTTAQARDFLGYVPIAFKSAVSTEHLIRLAVACAVRLDSVRYTDGTALPQNPEFQALLAARKDPTPRLERGRELLSKLDPAKAEPIEVRSAALLELTSVKGGGPALELVELFALGIEGKRRGTFAPISPPNEAAQLELAKTVISAVDHLGASAAVFGLYTTLPEAVIVRALSDAGYSTERAAKWGAIARGIQELDPPALESVFGDVLAKAPSFDRLGTAVLLRRSRLTLERLQQDWPKVQDDPQNFFEALLDHAAQTDEASLEREAVRMFVEWLIGRGDIGRDDVRSLLDEKRSAVLAPNARAAVDRAITEYLATPHGDRRGAIESISAAVKLGGSFVDTDALAEHALGALYQSDLANVLPLAEADRELGGVPAGVYEPERSFPEGTPTTTIGGIELKLNDRADKDRRAIPRASNAELVMTETTQRNVRLMSAAWRKKRPVLLEGPTSSGKTSAVRYLAFKTGSPYRRINLSYHTDVSDLLGRYVSGDGPDAKPRWVDGPVIKAMKQGEVLLLDEMNLARPEVLERLNSLFDDDGNVVLTEHHNEVISPDDNFRLFATMNPASYSGRAQLSAAMRSRWNPVYAHGLKQKDLTQVLQTAYGDRLPAVELAKLVSAHDALSRAADEGEIGRSSGGVAFTLRNLFRVAERFVRYRGGELSDDALMRRETEEIYAGGLFDEADLAHVRDVLKAAMPYDGAGFYEKLELKETDDTFEIGDVKIQKLKLKNVHVPGESARLVDTPRTKQIFYRLAKALDMGENVALIGERAAGKTAIAKMYAMLRGQPYHRQMLSGSTDTSQLIGGYDDRGWKDGLLLDSSRPDGQPGVFLGDELNLASSALLERLNSVLDDERKLVLAEKEGEEIRLHPEFRFVAAMNPPTKDYGGRNKLSKAMQNRFTMIWVPGLEDVTEQKQICAALGKTSGVSEAITDVLVNLQKWINDSYRGETLGKELRAHERPAHSIRQLLSAISLVSEFQKELGPVLAYVLAVEVTYASSAALEDNAEILKKAKELAQ